MRLLSFLLAALITASAAARTIDTGAVDRLVTSTLQQWQVPGASIAIVQDDRVVYVRGYGTRDGVHPVTPDTLFQIASTTKAFTSTALAMLATDGKLSFDDPVRKHVPYFRIADVCTDAQVLVRDIVSHRTGLPRRDELWDDTPLTREEVVRRMGMISPDKPFRSSYGYHNIMFIAAGEAVTHASGMPWDDFVRTRIFEPLGMAKTVISDEEWDASTDRATGYRWYPRGQRLDVQKPIDTTTIGAGGGIKSSARDMAQWIRFHLAGGRFEGRQLVDPEHLAETKMPHTILRVEGSTEESNPETNLMAYAMGWTVMDYRGERFVAHAGALNGFRTQVALLPKRNAGVVVLINAGRGFAGAAIRNSVVDLLVGKGTRDWNAHYLELERKSDEKAANARVERLARRIPDTSPTRPLAEYAGEYRNEAYGPVTITVADGQLVLRWIRITAPLRHYHYDVFDAEEEEHGLEETVTFGLDEEKKVKTLTFFGERFDKVAASPGP